jgi:hypothetical protein
MWTIRGGWNMRPQDDGEPDKRTDLHHRIAAIQT